MWRFYTAGGWREWLQAWRQHSQDVQSHPVGASSLAMNPRTPRDTRLPALLLTTIASKLAPTEGQMAAQPCRSELAREKPENAAGCQDSRVTVDVHREQARSYRRPTCRSELAREKPENAAGYQASRVIVDDHRAQARSYIRARSHPIADNFQYI
jgi:hypothetical protein